MGGALRRNQSFGGIGPKLQDPKDHSGDRKVIKPKPPNLPACTTRAEAGLGIDKKTQNCHLKMGRPNFVEIKDPDMGWVRSFMAEDEGFVSLWKCEPCGRFWLRYARKDTWGKRAFRWTHIWPVTEEE